MGARQVDSAEAARLHELLMEVVRAAGLLQPDHTVAGHPVSLSQAFALHELDTGVPLSQGELAGRLHLEKSTVSRLAAELERQGLLVRERDPGNRRLYRLRLTDEGRAVHLQMAKASHEHYVHWVDGMSEGERQALLAGLGAFLREVHRHPPRRHARPGPDSVQSSLP